jgi:hypothetical protein
MSKPTKEIITKWLDFASVKNISIENEWSIKQAIRRLIESQPEVDREDLKSMIGEGFHTAFRKAFDSERAMPLHTMITELPDEEWDAVLEFVLYGLIPWFKEKGIQITETKEKTNENERKQD